MSHTIAPVLGEATVQELREVVRGEILTTTDDGYAEASRIWNAAHDGHSPALVVRCSGAADVMAFPFLKYAVLGMPPDDDELFHRVLVEYQPLRDDSPLHAWVRRVDAHPRS